MDDLIDFIKGVGAVFIMFTIGVVLLVTPINYYEGVLCKDYQEQTGLTTKYNNLDQCYIQTKLGWMGQQQYTSAIMGTLSEEK